MLCLAKETIRGTAVSPATIFIPVKPSPQLTPTQTWAIDDGLRGSPVDNYNDNALTFNSVYEFRGDTYVDTIPNLLMAAFGGPDTSTGTTTPVTHAIPLLNAHSTGSQPPSYTLYDVDLVEDAAGTNSAKQIPGGQLDNLDFDFVSTGTLGYSSRWIGGSPAGAYVPAPYPTTLTFSNTALIPAWNCAVTMGAVPGPGTTSTIVESGSLSIKRKTESIWTLGAQSPYRNYAGPMDVSGRLTFVALAGDTTLHDGTTYSKKVLTLQFNDVSTGTYNVKLQMSQVQLINPRVTSGKRWVTIETEFRAEGNATDSGVVGQFAPMAVSVTNGQMTAY